MFISFRSMKRTNFFHSYFLSYIHIVNSSKCFPVARTRVICLIFLVCYVSNEYVIRKRTMTFRLITLMEIIWSTERMDLQKRFFHLSRKIEINQLSNCRIEQWWPIRNGRRQKIYLKLSLNRTLRLL